MGKAGLAPNGSFLLRVLYFHLLALKTWWIGKMNPCCENISFTHHKTGEDIDDKNMWRKKSDEISSIYWSQTYLQMLPKSSNALFSPAFNQVTWLSTFHGEAWIHCFSLRAHWKCAALYEHSHINSFSRKGESLWPSFSYFNAKKLPGIPWSWELL